MTLGIKSFYVAGGTLPRDAPSYVNRRADTELFEGLLEGRFCYVLTSRQMGKSSLMVRTAGRLREKGVTCAVLDLTAIGQDLTREQWYDGLQNSLGRQLGLEEELDAFWLSRRRLHPLQRWMLALEQVVLNRFTGPIVLFLDEIDSVRSLPFAADEFFAGIREFYNRRAESPALERLTFCLLGVASPSDLIRDTRTTPFNIGLRIDLTDFNREESAPLNAGLCRSIPDAERAPQHPSPKDINVLDRVLYWTGGHPYLTQRLCHAVATDRNGKDSCSTGRAPELVDTICANLLVSAQARVQNDNLLFVRDRLLRSEIDVPRLLGLYAQIHRGRYVRDDEADPLITVLRLSGITRSENGRLRVRNRIYSQVFDQAWVAANMPDAEVRRQRSAFRSGALRATALFGAVIVAVSALGVTAKREAENARRATVKSRQYADRMEAALKQADSARSLAVKEAGRVRAAETKLVAALKRADERRLEAEHQKRNAKTKQDEAENARRKTAVLLRDSYLAQAQASRWSSRIGQKFDSLAALEKAARYPAPPEFRMRLRDEAIAAMALPIDLSLRREREVGIGSNVLAIDEFGRRAATAKQDGTTVVWDMTAGKPIFRFPGSGEPVSRIEFSRSGRFLAVYDTSGARIRVWDLRRRVCALNLRLVGMHNPVLDSDDRSLIVITNDGTILRRNLLTGAESRIGEGTGGIRARLRPSPDGRWLAHYTSRSTELRIIERARNTAFSQQMKAGLIQVTWSQDSSKIAAVTSDHSLVIWSVAERRLLSQLGGHLALPEKLTFLAQGGLVATCGMDATLRIWDIASGRQVLGIPIGGSAYRFSPDGRSFYLAGNERIQEYAVDRGLECRVFPHATGVGNHGIDFLRGSSLMVTGGEDGLRFWDVENGREEACLPTGSYSQATFTPDASNLIRWDGLKGQISVSAVSRDTNRNSVRIGWPFAARRTEKLLALRCSPDGRRLVTADENLLSVFDLPGLKSEIILQPHPDVSNATLSPDKRWAASSGQYARNVKVWDIQTRRCVKEIPTGTLTNVAFSPDGKWLVTGNAQRFQYWRVGSWALGRDIPRAPGMGLPGPIAFSNDARQAALGCSQSIVHLYDSENGILLARLEGPSESLLTKFPKFSPDSGYLAAGTECGAVYLWDLRRIRSRLAKMGLDWDYAPISVNRPSHPLKLAFEPDPSR